MLHGGDPAAHRTAGMPAGGRTSQRYPNLAVPGMSSEWVISCYELSPRISTNFWKTWTKAGGPVWAQIEHTNTAFDRLCCCSVAQSCPTLWDPTDWSTAGLSLPHHRPEFAQVYVHWWASPIAHGGRIRLQCRRPCFNSWVRKIRWRRDGLPTPVLGLPLWLSW